MTGFIGRADGQRVVAELTPETLRALLLESTESVVVENTAQGAGYAQALRLGEQAWQVEVRGGGEQHVAAQVANTDAAFDLLRSWAAGDGWWRDAFSWDRVDPGPQPPTTH